MAGIVSSSAWRLLLAVGSVLLLALAVGWFLGYPFLVTLVVLAVVTGVNVWKLLRIDRWLHRRRREDPPDYEGVWGDIIATVTRIDRRKQFHKQRVFDLLREFRRFTTAMPDGAVLLNLENEIVWFNQRAAQWLKLKRKRDFGIRIENLLRHPDFVEYLQRAQRGEASEDSPVVPMPGESGRWISVYLVYTRDAPRRLLIVRDVSHQVMLETMRKEFVANASHELRSPLTVVSGYLEALGDDTQLAETWREPISEMRRQADRMRGIIDDLLELSRIEGHPESAGAELVDVAGLLAVLRKDIASAPTAPKVITLTIDTDAKLCGEERELASVFDNLVSNAVKYTPRDGAIRIRWWMDRDGGHLSVSDTGVGIAPEHIPRLTERFYRVDAGRARALGGSGLGLAIVKHALQRHEATLEIQSELGKGSVFTCHFPLSRVVPS